MQQRSLSNVASWNTRSQGHSNTPFISLSKSHWTLRITLLITSSPLLSYTHAGPKYIPADAGPTDMQLLGREVRVCWSWSRRDKAKSKPPLEGVQWCHRGSDVAGQCCNVFRCWRSWCIDHYTSVENGRISEHQLKILRTTQREHNMHNIA